MSLSVEYRRRAIDAEGLAAQTARKDGRRWRGLARSRRELADRLESEDTGSGRFDSVRPAAFRP